MSKKKRNYDEVSVCRDLNRVKGCELSGRTITIDKDNNALGNGSWGKVDYLVKIHKYVLKYDKVTKYFTHVGKSRKSNFIDNSKNTSKISIKDMVQHAMLSSSIN